ncbi:hypothetical protein FBUS_01078 [Fasciolopsis buskii]|uniref:Uncharacterized protein n=1 Tax=Fasciolopsis buskii TaxID=27845 RepID=A0A8E0RUD5_9TREM|nr:hypothetical protein FBUS_01078 [Fasciolopsis buski]
MGTVMDYEVFITLRLHDITVIRCVQQSIERGELVGKLRLKLEVLLRLRTKILQTLPFVYQNCAWSARQDRSQKGGTWQPDNCKLWNGLIQLQLRIAFTLVLLVYRTELTEPDLDLTDLNEIG